MTKQKKGFWLFIASCIPGAGELYMGFKKQGLSLLAIFWGLIAVAQSLNFGFLLPLLPIIWIYSFFNVHNLKSLREDEFYSIQDDYVFHLDRMIGNKELLFTKYRAVIGVGLILIGTSAIWNMIPYALSDLLPPFMYRAIMFVGDYLPRIIFGIAIVCFGFYLIFTKKNQLNKEEIDIYEENHFYHN